MEALVGRSPRPRDDRPLRGRLARHLEPEFGDRKTSAVTHEVVQRYIDGLRDRGAEPGTVSKVHAVLSAAFTEAIRLGIVHANPCRHVRLPRAEHREMLFLSTAEVAQLADAIDPHYRVLVYTAAYTGLRAGELAGLRREDVDLLHGTLTVRQALKDVNSRLEFGPTKTHAQRRITLPTFLRQMLEEHMARSPAVSLLSSRACAARRSNTGSSIGATSGPRSGPPFRRRSNPFASTTSGTPARACSSRPARIRRRSRSGSATRRITMTLDRYGHLLPGLGDSLADALDQAYESAGSQPSNVARLRRA